jgi:glycosyltransferase involved in cell wall biosynthesis
MTRTAASAGRSGAMRIVFDATAIPLRPTGAGNYILNLISALAAIDAHNQYFIFAAPDYIEQLGIRQANFTFLPVRLSGRGRRLIWEQIGLPGRARALGAHVLHSPHYTMPILKRARQVVTFHDMTFFLLPEAHGRGKRIFFRAMMRWSARHSDRLIAVSQSTGRDIARVLGVPASKIAVTPEAAGPAFHPQPQATVDAVCAHYGLTSGRYIYYVGVLEPRKNVPLLIEAYAAIAASYPDVPLVLAGKKGWMYEAIFARVQALGLVDRVRFLGHVPLDHLIGLYSGAAAFAYPSRYEGFGLPVLEAMQCGAPVVTSNVSSMPEVVGDAAILVDPDDARVVASALRRLLDDPVAAAGLGRRGIERARSFSWERCARETLQVYESLR